ncbi:MAG: GDP-L-fucose synthase [Verrucomicrobia subdivision 3 bacterium]|nr:GDP-L-fucose synthase [Limisphaerales bacterium]MCS1417678.1 GDP-L-fucose synthase [Limisphaerales bacterium]
MCCQLFCVNFTKPKEQDVANIACWGKGKPLREFLHANDLAADCPFLLKNYDEETIINVGSVSEISIRKLTELIRNIAWLQNGDQMGHVQTCSTPRKRHNTSPGPSSDHFIRT